MSLKMSCRITSSYCMILEKVSVLRTIELSRADACPHEKCDYFE